VPLKKYPTTQVVQVETVLEQVTQGKLHGVQTLVFAFAVDGGHWIHWVPWMLQAKQCAIAHGVQFPVVGLTWNF
jgi:hypothetical protein